jgi:hypothetical protein
MQFTTKLSIVKFEVEGTATITGKEMEINRMLGSRPETKTPLRFPKSLPTLFHSHVPFVNLLDAPFQRLTYYFL